MARTGKNNEAFLSGKIFDEKVLAFKNKRKESDRHPDYIVMAPAEEITPPSDDDAPF